MRVCCKNVSGYKRANLIENGQTPLLPTRNLEQIGCKIAVYALTLLNASIGSIQQALACLNQGETVPGLMNFKNLRQIVGFDAYDAELDRYHDEK
jgi:2-methylisocitrate lyase-like PEP mutase family enzyme